MERTIDMSEAELTADVSVLSCLEQLGDDYIIPGSCEYQSSVKHATTCLLQGDGRLCKKKICPIKIKGGN